jgi:hypothetical protein
MSYRVNPDHICETEGCRAPRVIGSDLCSACARCKGQVAARIAERADEIAARDAMAEGVLHPAAADLLGGQGEARPPRCVAYLSRAGDVITLELTGEPRFTEADVDLCAKALARKACGC